MKRNNNISRAKRKALIIVENSTVPVDPRVWNEARSLKQNGYQVTVLCPRRKGYERGYELLDGVHIYRHPMPREGNGSLRYLAEYACALFWQYLYACWIYLRRGFHVIQGCNPPDNIVLVALPFKLLGVKYIFDHHDVCPELYLAKFGTKGTLYRLLVSLEKLTYRFSDVVMCTNGSYRDLAVTRGGVDTRNAFIVRNGPDLKRLKAVPPNPTLTHGKTYLVGYVGAMGAQDGLDILVDVALHIKRTGRRDIHFTCVGGGPELPALRTLIRDHDIEDMVNFTGRIPDDEMIAILSTADVCVNPDKPCEMNNISTMIKIMEYMALGKPIVQFDFKEGRISAQSASLYADPNRGVADFASKILWLLDNPEARARMGAFGRQRVERELAWKYSVDELLAAYQRALGGWKLNTADRTAVNVAGQSRRDTAHLLEDRFRCSAGLAEFVVTDELSQAPGYFKLGSQTICFGQCANGSSTPRLDDKLPDALKDVVVSAPVVHLPFDPAQVIDNLHNEKYCSERRSFGTLRSIRSLYYTVRPAMPVSLRKQFQKVYFRGWGEIPFPSWPVDSTVEDVLERLLVLSMEAKAVTRIPFIWFWPDGYPSCTMVTHDVETSQGLDFCPQLMDLDDSFGIKSSFQLVPEKRYEVSQSALDRIQKRGFEVNVHDLNHDGMLMDKKGEFLRRAERINCYARRFGAQGFRSAVMYRNTDWYDALDFSYDMSIPNVAHLEPQRGGCCTVFPFFVGKVLELPLTTIQDYSLFNILNDYSIRLWQEQISMIRKKSGLISFIVHPDYIIKKDARRVYTDLLGHLYELRSQGETWIALPADIAAWWRARRELSLVDVGGSWQIQGRGSERARLAYAVLNGNRISYELAPAMVSAAS